MAHRDRMPPAERPGQLFLLLYSFLRWFLPPLATRASPVVFIGRVPDVNSLTRDSEIISCLYNAISIRSASFLAFASLLAPAQRAVV
eukprot:2290587-Rhodomonas_salina.2